MTDSSDVIDDPLRSPPIPQEASLPKLPKLRQPHSVDPPVPPDKDLPPKDAQQSTSAPPSAQTPNAATEAFADVKQVPIRPSINAQYRSSSYSNQQSYQYTASIINDNDTSSVITRAFAPHVSILASAECEELVRHKGINGGLLELLRPYGERVAGRVVIRDSTGASKPWDDFGIRFVGIRDGLEPPRQEAVPRFSEDKLPIVSEYRPARLRSGGDQFLVDEVISRHLARSSAPSRPATRQSSILPDPSAQSDTTAAYPTFIRKLLSGTITTPHETFAHPVAIVIAISSRNTAPIDELRALYTSSKSGPDQLPTWVNNDFLRYYVLIHDEDYDDIKTSTVLYEQMKRNFGLHCHLLRLRSTQCDEGDQSAQLPLPHWASVAEALAESSPDIDNEAHRPHIFVSDVAAIQSFVRELVTQSIVPVMERMVATWNDQVASRRRGISGRFMSLSKRFTPFAGRSVTGPASTASAGNYDATVGSYRPDTPEAIMRKLADYAFMLRDYKLAQSVYEITSQDYKSDKAWKLYAGANEMTAMSMLLIPSMASTISTKIKNETIDQLLDNAYYSYMTRCAAPFYAMRTLAIGAELLRARGGASLDLAAKWLAKILDDRLVGRAGHALVLERTADCFAIHAHGASTANSVLRTRRAAFWAVLASQAYLELGLSDCASKCLTDAKAHLSRLEEDAKPLSFEQARRHMVNLDRAVNGQKPLKGMPVVDAAVVTSQPDISQSRALDNGSEGLGVNAPQAGLPPRDVPRGASAIQLDRVPDDDGFV